MTSLQAATLGAADDTKLASFAIWLKLAPSIFVEDAVEHVVRFLSPRRLGFRGSSLMRVQAIDTL